MILRFSHQHRNQCGIWVRHLSCIKNEAKRNKSNSENNKVQSSVKNEKRKKKNKTCTKMEFTFGKFIEYSNKKTLMCAKEILKIIVNERFICTFQYTSIYKSVSVILTNTLIAWAHDSLSVVAVERHNTTIAHTSTHYRFSLCEKRAPTHSQRLRQARYVGTACRTSTFTTTNAMRATFHAIQSKIPPAHAHKQESDFECVREPLFSSHLDHARHLTRFSRFSVQRPHLRSHSAATIVDGTSSESADAVNFHIHIARITRNAVRLFLSFSSHFDRTFYRHFDLLSQEKKLICSWIIDTQRLRFSAQIRHMISNNRGQRMIK